MERGFLMLVLWMSNFHFTVYSNTEILNSGESMRLLFGDALTVFRSNLSDPNDVLTSWDAQHANPCKWVHITCNADNEVVRIDLGDANLSGQLVPQLGSLTKLQYLELYNNSISGKIPSALGSLPRLVSLDLYHNKLSGPIPDELGNLLKLRFLRLNNNSLSGSIPMSLTTISTLQLLDLSFNNLSGIIPVNGSFALFNRNSFLGNPYLNTETPSSSSPMVPARGQGATGAIAGGIASALSFSAIATALIW